MIKTLVSNIVELRKPCARVESKEDVKQIIQDLRDTLAAHPEGIGLSANQLGYNKQISYLRIPTKENKEKKTLEYLETIMINPEIIERGKPLKVINEGCLSFPGARAITRRYNFVAVHYFDENFKEFTNLFVDMQAFAALHEIDHLRGITIFDRKWVAR